MKPLWFFVAAAIALGALLYRKRLSRLQLIGAAVAAVAAVVYGTGAVHLPNIEHLIGELGEALGPWTYLLVAVGAFLETGAFVGLVAPGETIMVVGGVVAGQGEIKYGVLIGIAWAAAVAGDSVSFFLGRRLGRDFLLRHGPRVQITEARLEQVEKFLDRRGGTTILIGRFVGVVRAVAPFVLGASRMPYRRFIPYDIIGAGLWATFYISLGFIFWRSFDRVANYASKGAFALGTVIVVAIVVVWLTRRLHDPEQRAETEAWLARQFERPMLRPFAPPVRFLVRRVFRPVWAWTRGPLRFFFARLTPGDLGLELTTLVAIIAVGSFVFINGLVLVEHHPLAAGDRWAADATLKLRSSLSVDLVKVITVFGTLAAVAAATLVSSVILVLKRHVSEAVVLILGLAITQIAVSVTKHAVDRARPADGLVDALGSSFPSGHAAHSVAWIAIAIALGRAIPWLAGRVVVVVGAIALAAAIGLSRVFLGVHYLSDVTAGWGLAASIYSGLAALSLVVTFVRQNRREPPS